LVVEVVVVVVVEVVVVVIDISQLDPVKLFKQLQVKPFSIVIQIPPF